MNELGRLGTKLKIPTLPSVVTRICSMVDDPEVGISEVGEVLAEDAPMTATVLAMANSASYGLQREVGTTAEAATVLGARALRNLTLQAVVIDEFDHLQRLSHFDVSLLWKHGALVAHLSKRLARACRAPEVPNPDEVYTCGLLHDLGRLVMLDGLRERYVKVLESARDREMPSHELEKLFLGTTHMIVGARVITDWNLPSLIAEVALEHHAEPNAPSDNIALGLVMMADAMAHAAEAELAAFAPETPTNPGAPRAPDPRAIQVDEQHLAEAYDYARELWTTLRF